MNPLPPLTRPAARVTLPSSGKTLLTGHRYSRANTVLGQGLFPPVRSPEPCNHAWRVTGEWSSRCVRCGTVG